MKVKAPVAGLLILFFLTNNILANPYQEQLFKISPPPRTTRKITTNPHKLLKAAEYALSYFNSSCPREKKLPSSKILEKKILTRNQSKQALEFIIKTIKEDKQKNTNSFRILNPKFLERHFSFIKWHSDQIEAKKNNVFIPEWPDKGILPKNKIKLTSYAIFQSNGNYYKSKSFPHALYEITSNKFDQSLRKKYTKQNVLRGVLEQKNFKNHIKPLVWLSRKDLEQALMQGSAIIVMPNGNKRIFNVYKSNDFTYNKKIKNSWNQKKYWYFKEIKNKKLRRDSRIFNLLSLGKTSFAGDVENLGLGKIIALSYTNMKTKKPEVRLGVLTDRGSAFSNNLYQLDLFAGIFNTKSQFNRYIRKFPNTVEAYILKKKDLL